MLLLGQGTLSVHCELHMLWGGYDSRDIVMNVMYSWCVMY